MQDLNDLHYFALVVNAGGFATAGRLLGIPKSRLSRRIAALERRLGVRLLQRTTRSLVLTEVGEQYYHHCSVMLQAAQAADDAVAMVSKAPRGRLRVSCPAFLMQDFLGDIIPAFLEDYPEICLEVVATTRRVNMLEEGIDVAIRVRSAKDEDPALISRRLMPAEGALVVEANLYSTVEIHEPADLAKLPALGAIESDRKVHWFLTGPDGQTVDVALEPRLAVENFAVRKLAALRGLGVTMLPMLYCKAELAEGTLVRLLPEWTRPVASLQAVYPNRRGLLPAARVFVDYLVQELSSRSSDLI